MANIVTRPELLLRIVEFQHGFPHDILLLHPILSERNEDHKDEECLEQTLTPWLNEYGVSRLDVLTRYIPMARNNLMRYALESGNTDAPAALYPTSRDLLVPEPAWRAQYGYEPSNKPEPYWRYAVCGGHLQVVKYLHSRDHPGYDAEMMDLAAASGQLSIVEFLHHHRSEGCSTEAMDAAASRGHLEVVKFLHAHRSEGCTANAMDLAARYGHNDVVIWLSTHRHEGYTTDAMDNAAAIGNLDLVQWLSANRSEGCTTRAMDRAASNGHLHVVEWLHFNRTEGCTTNAMEDTAQYGHLPVVEFLAEHPSEGACAHVMDLVAGNGHIDVMEWSQKQVCLHHSCHGSTPHCLRFTLSTTASSSQAFEESLPQRRHSHHIVYVVQLSVRSVSIHSDIFMPPRHTATPMADFVQSSP